MVGGTLPADADVFPRLAAGLDRLSQQGFHRRIALVERLRYQSRVAVQSERELREIVRPDRESVEVLEKLLGEHRVRRHLAHHDEPQAVLPALQAVHGEQLDHLGALLERAHERHHDLDIDEADLVSHAAHRLAFHVEAMAERLRDITRGAAESEHRILLVGLVARAAGQFLVFVRLEIRQAHDHRLRPERRGDGRNAFAQLFHEKGARIPVASGRMLHLAFEVGGEVRILEHRPGMHADHVVDDEFQSGEPDPPVRQRLEVEGEVGIADIHRDFHRTFRHFAVVPRADLDLEDAAVDVSGVAFGAGHGAGLAVFERGGGIAAADHRGDAELAGDDGCVAGAAAAVGDDGRGTLHHRLPVGVGHIGHDDVAGLDAPHLRSVLYDAHDARPDLVADGAARGEHLGLLFQEEALLPFRRFTGFHRLGPRLQDIYFSVSPVLRPLDIHGALVVLLDLQREARKLDRVLVAQAEAAALGLRHVHRLPRKARLSLLGKYHLLQFRAEAAPDYRKLAPTQHRLVDVELVGVDRALHHHLAQTP